MIKYALCSLPIYQSSMLVSPKSIMDQVSRLIRDFLWKGGKGNQNKFHLVSWDTVKRPLTDGGLQERDPRLVNMALGRKILWNLFSNRAHHPVNKLEGKIPTRDPNAQYAT